MKREMTQRLIKFRGVDKHRNEWVYGYLVCFGNQSFIIEYGKPGIPAQQIEVIPNSVGQFTGLHDKNGKEIWEGDVVQGTWNKTPVKGEVVYDEGMFGVVDDEAYSLNRLVVEVIGNIYENPELLKQ